MHKLCICSNGATLSGLFICAFNAIDKLNGDNEVNLYDTVVKAKFFRTEFINTIVSSCKFDINDQNPEGYLYTLVLFHSCITY